MEKQIETLINLGGDAVQSTLSLYTTYIITSSIIWIAINLLLMAGCLVVWKLRSKWIKKDSWDDLELPSLTIAIVSVVVLGLNLIALPVNVIDLLNPEAMAIHQLLQDTIH